MPTIIHLANVKQPHPVKGDKRVLDLIKGDLDIGSVGLDLLYKCLEERANGGLAKYKVYLETNNGRDSLVDALQESLDLIMYLRQVIGEGMDANRVPMNTAISLAMSIIYLLQEREATKDESTVLWEDT